MILKFVFMFSYVMGNTSFPKPLTVEEENKYFKEYSSGNAEARNILIERNLRLVAHIVKKYNYKDNEDLISIGTIGLIKAIKTFNPSKGIRLATYAARCIENEILMNIRASKKHSNDISLQGPIGIDNEGNEISIEDKLSDEGICIEEQVNTKIEIKNVYNLMSKILKKPEQLVIQLRYGLVNGVEKTQREIADMMGISRSYVSRIEKKALKKLNKKISGNDTIRNL